MPLPKPRLLLKRPLPKAEADRRSREEVAEEAVKKLSKKPKLKMGKRTSEHPEENKDMQPVTPKDDCREDAPEEQTSLRGPAEELPRWCQERSIGRCTCPDGAELPQVRSIWARSRAWN